MKIAAHISYYYIEDRLVYLNQVIGSLLEIDEKIDIYIYTNKEIDLFNEFSNIKILVYPYPSSNCDITKEFSRNIFFKLVPKKTHPYYLTWEHRKVIESKVDDYDAQIYLEDDINFTKSNFNYWLKYNELTSKNNYNLGFLRFERSNKSKYVTDLTKVLTETIVIDGVKCLINDNNPYCGFWIYSQQELKEFVKSKEWRFKFDIYRIREKAAIGWHGINMKRYKGTIIPLEEKHGSFITPDSCSVHHLPNKTTTYYQPFSPNHRN